MLSTSAFMEAMIPLYIMAFIGFIGRKVTILKESANQVMTQLMLYITLPALILFSLNTDFSIELFKDFSWLVSMSFFILFISVVVAFLLRRRALLPANQKSVYESLIIFGNQGFIGFALSYILMGDKGIIYLTLFNICYLVLIWTYGIHLFTKKEQVVHWRILFLNPGILATLIGLCILFLPFSLPSVIINAMEDVGKITIPLSMILIGSMLADIRLQDMRQYFKNIYVWIAALYKLLIIPLFLLVFLFLNVPFPLLTIAVLTAAMPSASTTSVYAQKFGGDTAFSSFAVLLSTLLCIITIPFLYSLLQWLHTYFY